MNYAAAVHEDSGLAAVGEILYIFRDARSNDDHAGVAAFAYAALHLSESARSCRRDGKEVFDRLLVIVFRNNALYHDFPGFRIGPARVEDKVAQPERVHQRSEDRGDRVQRGRVMHDA